MNEIWCDVKKEICGISRNVSSDLLDRSDFVMRSCCLQARKCVEKAAIGMSLSRADHRRGRGSASSLNAVMHLFCVSSQ